jgi:hypothetical protein
MLWAPAKPGEGGGHGGDNHNTAQGKGERVGEAPRWLSDAAVTEPSWSE